jgi:3-isopropylmalate dehydratase small subunit
MEDADPTFAKRVQQGDVIVAGENFGCGSSREHAPLAIKGCGVSCVVAESFARIFYRNAINSGLPILECPAAVADTQAGDALSIDLQAGTVTNERTGNQFAATPFPGFIMSIIEAGGLVPFTRERLSKRGAP